MIIISEVDIFENTSFREIVFKYELEENKGNNIQILLENLRMSPFM